MMHYTGKLQYSGNKFDSSRDRGEPFSFVIGKGQVITGWDQGIVTMSLGERAILHVPSYKGYGSKGIGEIPPHADLDFDVELLAINDKTVPGFTKPHLLVQPEHVHSEHAHSGGNHASTACVAVAL